MMRYLTSSKSSLPSTNSHFPQLQESSIIPASQSSQLSPKPRICPPRAPQKRLSQLNSKTQPLITNFTNVTNYTFPPINPDPT